MHVIDPKVLDMVSIDADKIGTVDKTTGKTVKVDLDRQLLKPLAGTGKMFCYDSPEYVKDMGTPDRFHQVEEDFKAGRVAAKNLSNKQKAVFLDRDGTINKYVGFLRNINEFELINGVAEAIKKINASGYLAIVVTNQPVIARGEVTFQELEEIHNKMETELGLQGAYLDAIYYCPHHPHKGYEGEVPELKIEYRAVRKLRTEPTEEHLWEVVLLYAGVRFKTYSGLPFTYEIRKGRNGQYTKELWIDRREKSKSLAWSTVLLALGNIKEVGEVVERPKALGDIRGVTYIYGIFYRFGLIDVPEEVKEKKNDRGNKKQKKHQKI